MLVIKIPPQKDSENKLPSIKTRVLSISESYSLHSYGLQVKRHICYSNFLNRGPKAIVFLPQGQNSTSLRYRVRHRNIIYGLKKKPPQNYEN